MNRQSPPPQRAEPSACRLTVAFHQCAALAAKNDKGCQPTDRQQALRSARWGEGRKAKLVGSFKLLQSRPQKLALLLLIP